MRYDVVADNPRSGWRDWKALAKDVQSLRAKDKARVVGLFHRISQVGLEELAAVELEKESAYVWRTIPRSELKYKIYRCKVPAHPHIHFRFFFLEQVVSLTLTRYYLLYAYKKKSRADGNDVESIVIKRAESLVEEW